MKLGADRKKLAMLGGLMLIGGYVVWTNVFSGSDSATSTTAARVPTAAPVATTQTPVADSSGTSTRRRGGQSRGGDWDLFYKDPKKAVDPSKVDPTLHLELLSKVQQVQIGSAQRDLFRFGDAPKPEIVAVNKPIQRVPPISLSPTANGAAAGLPSTPLKPQPPAIQLKYYGYANPRNNVARKRAFFLDGEDIIVASEGDLINKRYKLVKIGVNSVTMEDTQFNNQQQLPLAQDVAT